MLQDRDADAVDMPDAIPNSPSSSEERSSPLSAHGGEASAAGAEMATKDTALASKEPLDGHQEATQTGFWPVLANLNFLVLWSGQIFSQLADKVYLVLMIAIIASQFESPGQTISSWVSAIMVAFTIPAVLFGSVAGVFVDRWAKKPILVLTNLLRGGVVVALPLMLWSTHGWMGWAGLPVGFWGLLVATFVVSTLTQFFAPAEQAIIPLIVEKRHLLSANSLYTTTMMASVILGFALGDPLLALADTVLSPFDGNSGAGKAILVGVGYTLAGIILLGLRVRPEKSYNPETSDHVLADIREGLRYLQHHPKVRSAMIQLVVLFSIFAALAVLAVRLAEVIPTLKSSQFGFLLSAGGVGMALGAAGVGQFGQRFGRRHLSLWGSIGMAIMLFCLAEFTDRLWLALISITCLGLFAALVGIPMQTTIQERTPEDMRGKVFGLQNNLINIALSLPLALAGIAETILGLPLVFMGLGVIVAAGGILTWYTSSDFSFQQDPK